jgi:hypothetical protein
MDVATWNVLHDGRLIAVEGTVPGELRLLVEIEYLCRHLPTQSQQLIVTLASCEQFVFHPYEQSPVTEPNGIAALGLELLSAQHEGGFLTIECADGGYGGQLVLRYASALLSTKEGRPLSQSEVESAAEQYWTQWKQKNVSGN